MATNSLPALRGAPPSSSIAAKPTTYAPNQTLYITNIPSAKIQKDDLKLLLYTLFTTYGPVLDIIASKTTKMRGQAHVTFRDVQAATQAMRALQEFEFLGRGLKISYAKAKSHTLAKLDGTFNKPAAPAGEAARTETQQSIFNGPPTADFNNAKPAASKSSSANDTLLDDVVARVPGSLAGQKRPREDDDVEQPPAKKTPEVEAEQAEEDGDESEGDAAMEEDSDDD